MNCFIGNQGHDKVNLSDKLKCGDCLLFTIYYLSSLEQTFHIFTSHSVRFKLTSQRHSMLID